MTDVQTPKIVKKKLFSPIWLLPIIALALGAWLGIKSIKETGVSVRIHFPSAAGIDVGKTLVRYQGLTVGKVVDMSIDEQLTGVNVDVLMDYRAKPFLNESTKFWLVKPKASITGVEGLDTLFSGNYIGILPGSGNPASNFEAEHTAPVILPGSKGLIVHLNAEELGSLDVGSPIFYRQIPVGKVVAYQLDGTKRIVISAYIQHQYAHLVKQDSQFWNVSGVSIDADLNGLKVNTESLAAILAGGISFNSNNDSASKAKNGQHFTLFDNKDDAFGGIDFTLTTDGKETISEHASIMFRGIEIGRITAKKLTADGVQLKAKFDNKYQELLTNTAKFWIEGASISLDGVSHPERLLTGNVINFLPGTGKAKAQYQLLNQAPSLSKQGKQIFTLSSQTHPDVKAGAEIRYKQIAIGKVIDVKFNKKLTAVNYQVEINAEFIPLITQGSYFVSQTALSIDASLNKFSLKTADLTTLSKGSVNLVKGLSKKLVAKNSSLPLFSDDAEAKQYFAQKDMISIKLISQDGADLSAGAPVYYKKMKIGAVNDIQWQQRQHNFVIEINIEKQFKSLLSSNHVFWRNNAMTLAANLNGIKLDVAPLQGAINGSISLGLLDANLKADPTHLYENKSLAISQSSAINISFPASAQVAAGAPLRYLGHQIGEVDSVKLNPDLTNLSVHAYIYGQYAKRFTQAGSQFFLVDAEISLAGVKAPEALLTGPYIGVYPSKDKAKRQTDFKGQLSAPVHPQTDSVTFTLTSSQLGSLKRGTPIFFRGIKIGKIDGYQLNHQGIGIEISAHIQRQYRQFVNQSSQFWELSGVKVDLGLFSGAKIETGSLETILAGGIGVVTKDPTTTSNALTGSNQFDLHGKFNPDWKKWAPIQSGTTN